MPAIILQFEVIRIICFFYNIVFIHGFSGFRPTSSTAFRMFSFWSDLIFTIARTLGVLIMASEINDESRKTIKILHCVPSNIWDMEVKRFSDDVIHNTVALTGMKFFNLTHKLILSVIGTIAAYELFLMQAN